MDATLASINIDDPTAGGADEEFSAPGVTSQAAEQKQRKAVKKSKTEDLVMLDDKEARKAEKKRKKLEASADDMDVDEDAIKAKLRKDKKEKRRAEALANGEVPDDQIKKKKKKSSV